MASESPVVANARLAHSPEPSSISMRFRLNITMLKKAKPITSVMAMPTQVWPRSPRPLAQTAQWAVTTDTPKVMRA